MSDTDVPDDLGPIDDPGPNDETTEPPKTAMVSAPLRVTKGTGHPGWMARPVHRRFPIRRSTLLIVLLAAGFEFLHIQYPSSPKATTTAPNGYIPAFIPAVSSTTTTTTTTQPVPAPTTTTLAPNASSTTSTLKAGAGSTTTTGVGGTSSTTTTLLPGLQGGSTTTSAPTTTVPS